MTDTATPADSGLAVEDIRDMLHAAYYQGAKDVHDEWIKLDLDGGLSDDPDFGEAAGDYARSIDLSALTPTTDSGLAGELAAVERHLHNGRSAYCIAPDLRDRILSALTPATTDYDALEDQIIAAFVRTLRENCLRRDGTCYAYADTGTSQEDAIAEVDGEFDLRPLAKAAIRHLSAETARLREELEDAYAAIRWVFQHGMKPDHERPEELNAIINESYASHRIGKQWAPPPRKALQENDR